MSMRPPPPPENWDELTPRERDEIVAIHVLDWNERRVANTEDLPPFSTDLTAAWQVVAAYPRLRFSLERFESVVDATDPRERTECTTTAGFRDMSDLMPHYCGNAENPAEAICIAALRVAGYLD
jgi:hypothetical protein